MKVRVSTIRAKKEQGEKFAMVTAYDAVSGRLAQEAGIEVILVGDSLATTTLGFSSTIKVNLEDMLHHAKAVTRGAKKPLLVGDMPFMSYKISIEQALQNAARMIQEGGMESVKMEGGEEIAPTISRLVEAGIPVMAHIGLLPQSIHAQGGLKVQGRSEEAAERILRDARALDDAGAFAMVLEAMPDGIAAQVTKEVSLSTIGIGAGPHCDAHVLVFNDLLGMTQGKVPKFVHKYANLYEPAVKGLKNFADEVRQGKYPRPEHSYGE